ncbi:MAG: Bax inhibitor-1/YccA family protein [Thermodesulfobacteriota bacterium]
MSRPIAIPQPQANAATLFLAKVFNWMAVGLGLTGLTAYLVAQSPAALAIIFGNRLVFYGLIAAEIGLVIAIASRVQRLPRQAASLLFATYAILNGLTLASVFLLYTGVSVASTFFVSGGMFAGAAVYGFVTRKDLTSFGAFLRMGLFGLILASLVNLFLGNPMMSWVISGIGVLVFTGLAAYDVQKLYQLGASSILGDERTVHGAAIQGALQLYLDFVNLFLMLLHFLGDRR